MGIKVLRAFTGRFPKARRDLMDIKVLRDLRVLKGHGDPTGSRPSRLARAATAPVWWPCSP
ncbi:hypothetical protein ACF07Q_17525 [Nocardiopsis dassonvillei]|uniref:hypothetical protein n=1 Tax=Nocardiopsis dassonvillei TaxID=2014 RepID=UPI0036F69560